jgi:hypothetical protein
MHMMKDASAIQWKMHVFFIDEILMVGLSKGLRIIQPKVKPQGSILTIEEFQEKTSDIWVWIDVDGVIFENKNEENIDLEFKE